MIAIHGFAGFLLATSHDIHHELLQPKKIEDHSLGKQSSADARNLAGADWTTAKQIGMLMRLSNQVSMITEYTDTQTQTPAEQILVAVLAFVISFIYNKMQGTEAVHGLLMRNREYIASAHQEAERNF